MTIMSNQFEWDLKRPERSIEGLSMFDIQKAKQIIVEYPREIEEIDLVKHREQSEIHSVIPGVHRVLRPIDFLARSEALFSRGCNSFSQWT